MRKCLRSGIGVQFILLLMLLAIPFIAAADGLNVSFQREESLPDQEEGPWAIRLRFNHLVFPSNLAKAIEVTVGDKKESFSLQDPVTNENATEASREFRLGSQTPAPEGATIRIVVKKGLSDATGRQLLAKEQTHQFRAAAEKVTVKGFSTFYRSPKDKGFQLALSTEVPPGEIRNALKITPQVSGLTVTRGDYYRNINVAGDFQYDENYRVEIQPIRVKNGRAVLEAKTFSFEGPGVKPRIALKTNRSVVELKSRQLLPLSLENVTKVRATLMKIPPYLAPEVSGGAEDKGELTHWSMDERKKALDALIKAGKVPALFGGDVVEDSDVFFAPEAKDRVSGYSLPLSFRKKPEVGGVWFAQFDDPDSVFKGREWSIIQITDLSISYKISAKTLLLWTTSIHTGEPLADVELFLCSSEGERFFIGRTDKSGLRLVKEGQEFPALAAPREADGLTKRAVNLADLASVVAATSSDCSMADLSAQRLQPFAVKQTKDLESRPQALRGYLFTERGIYLPGETVFFKCVVRSYEADKIVSPKDQKVKLEIVGPRGDVAYSKEMTVGEFGSCHDSFAVKTFAPVGLYTLKAQAKRGDAEKAEFNTTFLVQEYKRPRHFVTISAKKGERISEEYIGLKRRLEYLTIDVNGQYYTGGPVKNARARWKATLVPVVNKVEGMGGFFFGNDDTFERFLESGESILDKAGNLKITIPLDSRLLTGLYGVKVSVTVLDIDGEPATDVTTFNPRPDFLVGVPRHPARVEAGFASTLKVVVVDSTGKVVPKGEVTAALLQKRYFSTQKRDEAGNINYLWEEGWTKSFSAKRPIVNGEVLYDLELNDAGEYMVAFTYEEKGEEFSSQTLFQVGWEEYENWMRKQAEKTTPTSNEILPTMTKKEYNVGETVTVDFHVRRPAKKCLVTLELGDILDYKVIDIKDKKGTYSFTASAAHQPNVYVSVIGAAGRAGFPVYMSQTDTDAPIVYFGYADVRIRSDIKTLRVEISPDHSDLKGRPGEKSSLTLKVTDHHGKGVLSELAVCVVDEAVLALTRFKTPDLSSLTDFNLPLAVFSGDLRLDLISQDLFKMFSTRPLTGGGFGAGFVTTTRRKDFRPVAYFNPAVLTNQAGEAKVEFQLPDTTTTYRVYAVACDKGAGFASNERKMLVTKEFFIEPSLPRFLIPGDKATLPVTLQNKTADSGEVFLEAQGSKDFNVRLLQTSAKLEPYSASVVKSTIEVGGGLDKGTAVFAGKFTGKAGAFSDAIEETVPIHSRYLPVNRVVMGSFTKKTEIGIDLPEMLKRVSPQDMNSRDFSAVLSLSATNWNRIAPGLRYLLHYPFGCVEQTSSGIIPLAGLRELIKSGTIPGITVEEVDTFLKAGVARILAMQQADGGFSYWPGRLDPSWWGTVYATYALTAARKAGYEVPEERLGRALKFIRDNLFGERKGQVTREAPWARQLALFVLAANKMLNQAELQPFFEEYDSLNDFAKVLVLLSAEKTGYLPKEKLAGLINRLDPKVDTRRTDYTNSTYRTIAFCLMAAIEEKAAHQKADTWAGYLLKGLRPEGTWFSTADTGWCLLALAEYYKTKAPTKIRNIDCTVRQEREKPEQVTISEASVELELNPAKLLDKGKVTVEARPDVLIHYTVSVRYPDTASDPSQLGKGLSLSKKMENLNGKDEIRVGDVVRITLEMDVPKETTGKRFGSVEYVALEDPVPAGLVPINSELQTEGAVGGPGATAGESAPWRGGFFDFQPTYSEFRDDGVRVFKNSAWTGSYRYTYLARATAQGDFWMRGSRVSLMYNPDLFGKTAGRRIQILPAE